MHIQGERYDLKDKVFDLAIGEPVRFQLYSSSTRLTDQPGELLEIDPTTMSPLPPLQTVLKMDNKKTKRTVPVKLEIELTEIGTLQANITTVESIDLPVGNPEDMPTAPNAENSHRWLLEFEARSSTDNAKTIGVAADLETLERVSSSRNVRVWR